MALPRLRLIAVLNWPLNSWPPSNREDQLEDWHEAILQTLHEAGADPGVRFIWVEHTRDWLREGHQQCILARLLPHARSLGESGVW